MMSGSEERWREGSGQVTPNALGHLLERVANDLTPQHDSQHYQSGFIPSATPPWTNSGQAPLTSLGSPMPSLQPSHTSLGAQCVLQPNHTNLGSQVPSMQSAHSNIGPKITPLQPTTTCAPGPMPPGPQLSGSSARSYSVNQDLFAELDGSRSPLYRSSSDLGLRLSHYQTQGSHFSDGRLDGFMDSSMDSLDGMLVGGHDPAYFLEVQRRPSAAPGTPPLQTDPQGIVPTQMSHQEFSFYSNENDRVMEANTSSNISAKFSNITASLGSWFNPFDPFRSTLTAAQTKTTDTQQSPVGTGTEAIIRSEYTGSSQNSDCVSETQTAHVQPAKAHKPSYSAVLSKNPVQEGKGIASGPIHNNRGNNNNNNNNSVITNSQQSPSPSPATTRPEQKARCQIGANGKLNKSRNSGNVSTANIYSSSGSVSQNSRQTGKNESHTTSRVGLDDFDLNDGSLSNGILSAYEHYDWGETSNTVIGNGPSNLKASTSSPSHQSKWAPNRGDIKKNTPEKLVNSYPIEAEAVKGNNHLNNKVTSLQQKQPPKRTPYINNNLSATAYSPSSSGGGNVTSSTGTASQASANLTTASPSHGRFSTPTSSISTSNFPTTNNNDHDRPDTIKVKNTQLPKEDRKSQDNVNGSVPSVNRGGSRSKAALNRGNERSKEPRRAGPPRRRKDTSFNHSELMAQGWAMCVQWTGLMVRAVMWLGTLATDVVVMSARLLLHLMVVMWGHLQEYGGMLRLTVRHNWARLTSTFTRTDKEEKKLSGRDKKVPGGLECNISLPTTGEEAMKRLLACKGKDPYSILGVTHDCTDDDIKKYYKRQAFLVHPDKNKQPGAEEAFKILAHAFEIIGEPERRKEYDVRLAEEVQLEGAWGELASLLTRLQEKLDEAANTIRCTNCNKRHRRVKLPRPIYAARDCAECKIHHAAREGDIWAESTLLGLRWRYYACMEGAVYDISDWAACQSDNLKHLQANTHSVQYRIVSGKKNPPSKNNTPEFPSDPDLEEFFNNLCKEKFGKNYSSGSSQGGSQQMPDTRKRKGKKKK